MCNSKICVRVTPPERSVKRKKEKGWCLILFGQTSLVGVKSGKHKRRRKRRKKNQKKKRKKAKRVVQTPNSVPLAPSLEKGRLSPFQLYFFINNYTRVCLLCLRERERERESQIRATLVVEDTRARLPQQQRIDRSRNTRYTAHRYLLNS